MDPVTAGSTDKPGTATAVVATPGPSGAEAPATAIQALQNAETRLAADPSSANPDLTSNGSKPPAAAIVQPGQEGVKPGGDGDPIWDSIPEPRRNIILENARKKAADEAVANHWSAQYDEEQVQQGVGFAAAINRNPIGFAVQLVGELMENPRAAALLTQHLGQHFGGGGEPAATGGGFDATKLPKGRLTSEDGKTRAYSEDQIPELFAYFKEQIMGELGSEIDPLRERFAALDEREEAVQVIHESRQEARDLLREMRALDRWPKPDATGKNPGEVKIHGYLAEIPKEVKQRIGYEAAVRRAFQRYLDSDVFPAFSQKSEEAAREDMKRKAAAAAGHVAPGGGAPGVPAKKPTNVRELAKHLESLASATGTLGR